MFQKEPRKRGFSLRETVCLYDMKNKETITEALGLDEKWLEEFTPKATDYWNQNDRISDALQEIASDIKDEEFGCNIQLSSYEKKLILAGFILGRETASAEISKKINSVSGLMGLLGAIREIKPDQDDEDEDED